MPPSATAPAPAAPPPASTTEAERAVKAIRTPDGVALGLFAAEPMVANPVAFAFDERGRVYVVETFRLHQGVTDNRSHMGWLDDDLASRTVEDRLAMYRKHLGKDFASYGKEEDRVRLIEDRDGDGRADHVTVFADGFRRPEEGLASGVLARRGDVYFTCIPSLWRLRDADGDGKADAHEPLQTGYGVHVAFLGHDLHGLRFGPDGKLYFSIGDRGLNVRTGGKTVACPDSGAVLRCNPDGSGLELFATGLRNPQELAFDQFGNLFTCDNNSDSGDKARWVYVVEGADSGWRIGYQYLESPVSRGPWNAEKLWHPRWDGQAAYLVPPLASLSDGPSGLAFEPGTSLLPPRYRHHFFLCDFRGSPGQSGVRSLAVRPKGAAFEVVDSEQFLWGLEATDVDFGPDGALYVSDWVEGWKLTGKGRIVRAASPAMAYDPRVREVKALLARGFAGRPLEELGKLLAHPDRRIRQEAQFALAERGRDAVATLRSAIRADQPQLARIHAAWALGQVAEEDDSALQSLAPLLDDPDAEIRAQAAKLVGDHRWRPATPTLVRLIGDSSDRVRFFAAIGLGKLGDRTTTRPLLGLLRENHDRDPFLRHAAVMGLVGIGDVPALLEAARDSSAAVRMGVLLALRRLGNPEIARFLDDPEPGLVLEAARAIYDVPVESALPSLAALSVQSAVSEPLLRRVINANARLGGPGAASALARLAVRGDLPDAIRVESLQVLSAWSNPSGRDRITGLWRPVASHPATEAAEALGPLLHGLVKDGSNAVQVATLRAVGPLPIKDAAGLLLETIDAKARPAEVRVEAMLALERLGDPGLAEAVRRAVRDETTTVRVQGQRLLAKLQPEQALPVLEDVLERGSILERQGAFATLAGLPGSGPDRVIGRWLDRLRDREAPPEVALDLIEAARRRPAPEVARKLKALEAARPAADPLASYRETLAGGDAGRGSRIVAEKAEVSCLRCHKVRGRGGEVGPDLTGIGGRQSREYLLEAIVAPGRQIAKGFETLVLARSDGQVVSGTLKQDDGKSLRLVTVEGKSVIVPKDEIDEQKRGGSAMPEDLTKHLSKAEIRDLVEYLATLR